MAPAPRNFVAFRDFSDSEIASLLRRAAAHKRLRAEGAERPTLSGKTLAMVFAKPSTRTRVSFEAGMAQLGGHALMITPGDSQMGRGEPVQDTARVLSSMCDAIMVRSPDHALVAGMAERSAVPVINGLSDRGHPCQILADLLTAVEIRGSIEGMRAVWAGEVNNVCLSWIEAADLLGFRLDLATPPGLPGAPGGVESDRVRIRPDLREAVVGADFVVTDVWVSMGGEDDPELEEKLEMLRPYRVTAELMAAAGENARLMHCLPAVRGQEVDGEVLDGPQSAAWQEAENRMHAQKALLEFLILGEIPA